MSRTQKPGIPGDVEDPEDVVERHRDTIEDAIEEFGPDHPGARRLQNLLDEFGGAD